MSAVGVGNGERKVEVIEDRAAGEHEFPAFAAIGKILDSFATGLVVPKGFRDIVHLHALGRCAVDAEGVQLGDERIASRTVLWGAGVLPSPLGRALEGPTDKPGRVEVTPELTLPGDPRISVVGDLAHVAEAKGSAVPGIAPAAMQMGRHAARNVLARVRGQPARPFHYLDKGTFAVIGRGAAVGTLFGRWEVSGFFAWLMWATIHLLYLVGFRSRLAVAFTWTYSYLTWRRIARLITVTPWARADRMAPDAARAAVAAGGQPAALRSVDDR
jgi:NADH dehydrogenase